MNTSQVKALLKQYGISPRQAQGQNFLLDETIVQQMVRAAGITDQSVVLEIGPGLGVLTREIIKAQPGQLLAVEQDRVLAHSLTSLTDDHVRIINQDIRTCHLFDQGLTDRGYILLSNLPYSISSWVLRQIVQYPPRPSRSVIMLQKEVAQRTLAQPGDMSILSVAMQLFAKIDWLCQVPPSAFYPAPAVDSAVIVITLRDQPLSPTPERLLQLAKIGFGSKRKQLSTTLSAGLGCSKSTVEEVLERIGLRVDIRPQMLSIENWESLRKTIDSISNI